MSIETVPQKDPGLLPAIHIRNLRIDPPLFLAPMAGLTHSALRRTICSFGGVGLLSTEMLSAKRLPTENPLISPCLIRTEMESPLSYQLMTSSEKEIAPAIEKLHAFKADAIDLNMGCPSTAVGKLGAGVTLMERPEEVRRIVAEARKLTALPLTAKIRLGLDLDNGKLKSFCSMLEDEGIDMLSVHARFRHESFARKPHWAHVAVIKDRLRIPVIVNGGIFTLQEAETCLRVSGADGLMLGRGAVIKPWLFAEIARSLFAADIKEPEVSLPEVYTRFIAYLSEHYRPMYRLGRLKEFTHYFARNYKFGHYLASKVQSSCSIEEAKERACKFFSTTGRIHPIMIDKERSADNPRKGPYNLRVEMFS